MDCQIFQACSGRIAAHPQATNDLSVVVCRVGPHRKAPLGMHRPAAPAVVALLMPEATLGGGPGRTILNGGVVAADTSRALGT